MGRTILAGLLVLVPAAFAQDVISAKSGTIHYYEGKVLLGGQQLFTKPSEFPQIKENEVLATEEGRVEVLLTPGVFLRVGEHSSVKLLSSRLSDTRLDLLSGQAVVEMADAGLMDAPKSAPITVLIKDTTLTIRKKGIYNLSMDQVKVFNGELEAVSNDQVLVVKDGRTLALDGTLALNKFDTDERDSLLRWTKHRAEYMSMASISAAKSVRNSGGGWNSSGWLFNPYFGMFTFIPSRGIYNSPFGYQFYSPYSVGRIYARRPVFQPGWNQSGWNGGGGYATMPRSGGGYSGAGASAPRPSAGASAPVSRGGGGGGQSGRSR
jgi:hypothetical protein